MIYIQLLYWASFLLLFVAYGLKCIRVKFPDGFDDISRTSAGGATDYITTSEFFEKGDNFDFNKMIKRLHAFYSLCHDIFKDNKKIAQINFDDVVFGPLYISGREGRYSNIKLNDKPLESEGRIFHSNEININGSGHIIIDKIKIGRLKIGSKFNGTLHVFNSYINSVTIEKSSNLDDIWRDYKLKMKCDFPIKRDIIFYNTFISSFKLNDECCNKLIFVDGGVSYIDYINKDKNSFCVNTFKETNTNLCMLPKIGQMTTPQGYRDLRIKIKDKCDSMTEQHLHTCELKLEKNSKNMAIRCCDFLYDLFSNYGNSPHRTIVWIFILIIFSTSTAFFCNLTINNIELNHNIISRNELHVDTFTNLKNSFLLSIQYIFNISLLFAKNSIVKSNSFVFYLWLLIQSLTIYGLIAIFILSIRRRYKISP